MLLVIPIVLAEEGRPSVTRTLDKNEIWSGKVNPLYPENSYVVVSVKVTVNEGEPWYVLQEQIPTGMEVVSTDFPYVDGTLMADMVVGPINKTYVYVLANKWPVTRRARFLGYVQWGSDYLNTHFTENDQLMITNKGCVTTADKNRDGKISRSELKSYYRKMRRYHTITLESYREAEQLYYLGEGC